MAGPSAFLIRLHDVLQALTDEALEDMTSRGLVRRARKDLQAHPPAVVARHKERIELRVGDAEVTLSALPKDSRCSCPAPGLCRHVMAAVMLLRDADDVLKLGEPQATASQTDASQTDASQTDANQTDTNQTVDGNNAQTDDDGRTSGLPPADVLGELTDEQLQKWAGKPLFAKAVKALAADPQVMIREGPAFQVHFPTRNITCRWIPSEGLVGLVCSCQAESVCEHLVTAVLAYQLKIGKRVVTVDEVGLQPSKGAARTRTEVLESVGVTLRELIALGIARLSARTVDRLTTLAVSAHGVDLPHLERVLKSLAEDVRSKLNREARSSSVQILAQAARLEALRQALATHPTPDLIGQHRTQYFDIGQITIVGLGARQWETKSGYRGVTVYFWDESRGDWATWSDSRPSDQLFDPVSRFYDAGPWDGCESPWEASSSVIRLAAAWRNAQGRLSGRPSVRAMVMQKTVVESMPAAIDDWSQLTDQARRVFGGGLSGFPETGDLVVLRPNTWGPPQFHSFRQELVQPILDAHNRILELRLAFSSENERAIELLEQHDPTRTIGLLGALRLAGGRVCVEPISLHLADRMVHLNLELSRGKKGKKNPKNRALPSPGSVPAVETDAAAPSPADAALVHAVSDAEAQLEALAEAGVAARRDLDSLRAATRRFQDLGLTVCARPLDRLQSLLSHSTRMAEPSHRQRAAAALLHAYYVLRLAEQQQTVAAACAHLQ